MQTLLPTLSFVLFALMTLSSPWVHGQKAVNEDDQIYKVVINHEEMYSIHLAESPVSRGWKDTSQKGTLSECHSYIEEVWTDMRPLSIRKMDLPANTIYGVVINHEEQYAVWPKKKSPPQGWKFAGKGGDLQECMDYIEEVWTDMRPLSLRKKMDESLKHKRN